MSKPELKSLKDQNVKIVLVKDREVLYGRVVDAMQGGVVLKCKGSSRAILIEEYEILSIELDTRLQEIKASQLQWPKPNAMRKHLSTHHGIGLSTVNELTTEAAVRIHDELHSSKIAYDLGHYHPGQGLEEDGKESQEEGE